MDASIGQLLEHATWARGLARILTRDDASADDVAQDAWVAALRNPPRDGAPRPWFAEVVRNARRMALRSAARRRAREHAVAVPDATVEGADTLAEEVELGRILADELLRLPEPYRETLLLGFYRGFTSAQIGARRGIPAATVRTHTKVALEKLRVALDRRYGDRGTWQRALLPLAALPIPRLAAQGASMLKIVLAVCTTGLVGGGLGLALTRPPTPAPSTVAAAPASPRPATPAASRKDERDRMLAQIVARRPDRRPPPSARAAADVPAEGSLDRHYVSLAVRELGPLFADCYRAELRRDPQATGKVVVRVVISGDPDVAGVVADSEVVEEKSTLKSPEVRECIQETMYAARFPPPTGNGDAIIEYPFQLSHREGPLPPMDELLRMHAHDPQP